MAGSRSPEGMMAAVVESLEERTGRTLDSWVSLVRSSGVDPLDQKAVRRWLKTRYDVPQNSQWAIADAAAKASGWKRPDLEEYIDQQYGGARADLRPIFDRLRMVFEGFGGNVVVEGRATYTPFVRGRQFATIAATRKRVDVGLRFRDAPNSTLLTPAKGPGQATHKLSLTSVSEITPDVERLLQVAYDQNG
jgi:hypothetical protein